MKKTILIMAVLIGFAGMSKINAQKQNSGKNASQRFEKMQEELNLSEEQADQIKTLHDQFRTEMKETRENESLSQENFHETIQQEREVHQDKIRNILNEEQKQKFDLLSEERGNRQYAKRPQNKRHSFLSDEQLNELKEKRIEFDEELSADEQEIISEFRLKRESWKSEHQAKNNKEGMRPQHGHRGFKQDREEMKPMFDIVKNHKESLMAILEEYRPERPENCPNDHPQRNKRERAGFGERPGFRAMHFLMMDTEAVDIGNVDEQFIDVNIFPNPARNTVNISYELPAVSYVSIELLSKYGNILEIIEQSYKEIGENSVQYNTSMLPPGEIYFVKVSTDKSVQVDKFIKM